MEHRIEKSYEARVLPQHRVVKKTLTEIIIGLRKSKKDISLGEKVRLVFSELSRKTLLRNNNKPIEPEILERNFVPVVIRELCKKYIDKEWEENLKSYALKPTEDLLIKDMENLRDIVLSELNAIDFPVLTEEVEKLFERRIMRLKDSFLMT